MKWTEIVLIPLCFAVSACGTSEAQNDTQVAIATNSKPIAKIVDMTPNKGVGTTLKFNGLQSYDADGDSLSYYWSLVRTVDQRPIVIESTSNEELSFMLDEEGSYSLRLYVNDGQTDSAEVQLEFFVEGSPELVAEAGRDFTVKKGQVIALNGNQSYSKNDSISNYHWEILKKPADSNARIFKNKKVKTNFVSDAVGTFEVQLTVTDSMGLSASDRVTITSDPLDVNSAPMAIIKTDKTELMQNEVVQLDGSKSKDPDRLDRLSYNWSIVGAPADSQPVLSRSSGKKVNFSADRTGEYTVELVVADRQGATGSSTQSFMVQQSHQAPIAILGSDRTLELGETINLACESCYDPDGSEITYEWQLQTKPADSQVQLSSTSDAMPTFTPDLAGQYSVSVRISDGELYTTSNTQIFDVQSNQQPSAIISPISSVMLGEQIMLDGTASSDPEGAALSYEWRIVSQPSNDVLDTSMTGKASLIPSQTGDYIFSLRTYDGELYSEEVTLTVKVTEDLAPVIRIQGGNSHNGQVGNLVTVDASNSYDPEGDVLNYLWKLAAPNGSSVVILDDTANQLQFTPDVAGIYSADLTVSDSAGNQSSTRVNVDVKEHTSLLSGKVRGRVVDTTLNGVSYAKFMINGIPHTADIDGFFEAVTQVENGAVIMVETDDARLMSTKHTTLEVVQDNFVINLGESFIPVNQDVDTYVWGCSEYTGPQEVNITFKMVDTFPAMSKFQGNYEQTFNFAVESNKSIPLPATATYEITTDEGVTITSSEPTKTIYYSPIYGAMNIINICN